jgi:hypothetical protein
MKSRQSGLERKQQGPPHSLVVFVSVYSIMLKVSGRVNVSGSKYKTSRSDSEPLCWDHGCSGRKFSSFSSLLKHYHDKYAEEQRVESAKDEKNITYILITGANTYAAANLNTIRVL